MIRVATINTCAYIIDYIHDKQFLYGFLNVNNC